MTIEEAKKALEQLKSEGYSEEDIVKTLYLMYANDKMDLDDLRALTELMGYEFTEEFEAMSDEDKKKNGLKQTESAAEGVEKEDVEKAKEFGDDEGEKAKEEDTTPQPQSEGEPKADEEEDDEKKAARLFGFGSNK